jgi:hypothetical protein
MFLRYLYVNDQQLYIYNHHLVLIVMCVYMNEELILMDIIGVYYNPMNARAMSDIQRVHHVGALWTLVGCCGSGFKVVSKQAYLSYIGSGPKVVPPILHC